MDWIIVVELLTLAIMLGVGCALVYVVFEMRDVYAEHKAEFRRMLQAVEQLSRFASDWTQSAAQVHQDTTMLGENTRQLAASVRQFAASVEAASREQTNNARLQPAPASIPPSLETKLSEMQDVLDSLDATLRVKSEGNGAAASSSTLSELDQNAVMRGYAIATNAEQRFTLLMKWVNQNLSGIMKRAERPWSEPVDLLSGIPRYFDATAIEINRSVLLIGTADYPHRIALWLPGKPPNPHYSSWFGLPADTESTVQSTVQPAIVEAVNDQFKVIHAGVVGYS